MEIKTALRATCTNCNNWAGATDLNNFLSLLSERGWGSHKGFIYCRECLAKIITTSVNEKYSNRDAFAKEVSNAEKEAKKGYVAMSIKQFRIVDGDMSDGYHTFDELYEHRCLLFLLWLVEEQLLCKRLEVACRVVYYQLEHYEGWDLVQTYVDNKQISYHVPAKYRHVLVSNFVEDKKLTEKFDGHSSKTTVSRMVQRLFEATKESQIVDQKRKESNELPGCLAHAMAVEEGKFPCTTDARIWAEKFCEIFPEMQGHDLTGWFANAIMAGADRSAVDQKRLEDLLEKYEYRWRVFEINLGLWKEYRQPISHESVMSLLKSVRDGLK